MKYYIIEISTNNEDQTAKAIYEYGTYDEACMVFHQTIASAMANANVKHVMVFIINDSGSTLKLENYERSATE